MLYRIIPCLVIICFTFQFPLAQSNSLHPKLKISFNTNVELLGFAYFLGYEGIGMDEDTIEVDGVEMLRSEFHAYGNRIYNKYIEYQASEHLMKAMTMADHLWLDYIISILLRVESFPNAEIPEDMPATRYRSFSKSKDLTEATENLTIFLDEMNAFYREIDFDRYLDESSLYYETAMHEIVSNMPDATFIDDMEEYFDRSYTSYHLVPSLTLPKTMGFGPRFDGQAFNVFGAVGHQQVEDVSDLQMGFSNADNIRELSVHEFGHSFVNPVLDQLSGAIIDSSESLFPPIQDAMYRQGYNNWDGSVYEHFVRTVELIVAETYRQREEYVALKNKYLIERRFIYIPYLKPILKEYADRDMTFEQAVMLGLKKLIALSQERS